MSRRIYKKRRNIWKGNCRRRKKEKKRKRKNKNKNRIRSRSRSRSKKSQKRSNKISNLQNDQHNKSKSNKKFLRTQTSNWIKANNIHLTFSNPFTNNHPIKKPLLTTLQSNNHSYNNSSFHPNVNLNNFYNNKTINTKLTNSNKDHLKYKNKI